ncbi:hypothetical protein EV174_005365 [Coemansia sp. RSA 2320]|nr:hypothetical protein EV174_005365 [Coemansia sp. RSA 2320]
MDRLPLPYAHSAQSAPETHSVAAMHRYPPRHSPMLISPLLPPGQHASEPRRITMPPTAAASTPDPVSEYALPPDAAPPPISSQAQQLHPSAGAAWPPEALVHPQALAAPALRSTPPQHMRQSAQFHASASPYAPEMRPSAAVAPSHPPAIYASAKADTPPADASGFQTQPTAAPDARQQLHLHPQSPSSPPLKQLHSSEYDRQHLRSREQPAPYDANPYVPPRHAPERALSAGTLPFSDGVARPRLPPLSEILGKDYQLVLSPSAGPHPHLDSHSSAGMPDRYPLPVAQHKDSFRNEVSKMLAHESLH